MTPLAGFRFVVAPHFHLDVDWPGRLSLAASVELTAQEPMVRPPWRTVQTDELAMLLLDPTQPGAREELPRCVCLFVVPVHLRSAFWDLVAQAEARGEISPDGFGAFTAEVGRFLAFKQLPLPPAAVCELVVNKPGQATLLAAPAVWALINLGEDAVAVVCLSVQSGDSAAPDCVPVRLQIEPGEGVRIPAGMMLGSDSLAREQPEVLLVIRVPEAHLIES
jgi:hypothetical protein